MSEKGVGVEKDGVDLSNQFYFVLFKNGWVSVLKENIEGCLAIAKPRKLVSDTSVIAPSYKHQYCSVIDLTLQIFLATRHHL